MKKRSKLSHSAYSRHRSKNNRLNKVVQTHVEKADELSKNNPNHLQSFYDSLPSELQNAITSLGKTALITVFCEALDVNPVIYITALIASSIPGVEPKPVEEASTLQSAYTWLDGFAPDTHGLCTAKNFADICGRSHLVDQNGEVVVPGVTREINAYTTDQSFTWGAWFTLRDCYTKEKVQAVILSVIEKLGLDQALSKDLICSYSSNKFQGTLTTTTTQGLSPDACSILTSELNKMSLDCQDGVRAGAINFGLAVSGIVGIAAAIGVCVCSAASVFALCDKISDTRRRFTTI